jgi:hypothetical protein
LKWDTVIEQKATELSRFLIGRSLEIGFAEPCPVLKRSDNINLRNRISSLTQKQASKLDIGKSTLHYLRKKSIGGPSFCVYTKVRNRIEVT